MTALILLSFTPGLAGCGTIRTHWGVEHEYEFDGDGSPRYYYGHHKPPKHKHKKKYKKYKKYKKCKKHHHHDDDDD